MGLRAFEAQFQQAPLPDGGGLIDLSKFPRHTGAPKTSDAKILKVDAATGSDTGSYSAILGGRISNGRLCVTYIFRKRMPLPELFGHVIALVETNKVDHVVVERASSGTALLELLWERYGHTKRCESFLQFLHPVKPTNAKTVRMEKAMIEVKAGRVYLRVSDPRLDEFEHELLAFPNDKNDDYIDALSQLVRFFYWFMNLPACRMHRGIPPH